MDIDKIITESINEFLKEGLVDNFTPYTPEQAKINKEAMLGQGQNNRPLGERNRSYGNFIAWRREQIANGVPSVEASWSNYIKQK
jgi:hypothetical protein